MRGVRLWREPARKRDSGCLVLLGASRGRRMRGVQFWRGPAEKGVFGSGVSEQGERLRDVRAKGEGKHPRIASGMKMTRKGRASSGQR